MKYQSVGVCLITTVLSGCTTMRMLSDSGDSFKKGDWAFGAFKGVSAITFGHLIDVFTLGRTLDSPRKVNQVYGTAAQSEPLLFNFLGENS